MGLDCSHDAFHGAYSSFNRLRQRVANAIGGSFPPHDDPELDYNSWYWGDGYSKDKHPGLFIFLAHSDCDGFIGPEDCVLVADDLEKVMALMDADELGGGHLERQGGYVAVLRKFIAGCRDAAEALETLEFQ